MIVHTVPTNPGLRLIFSHAAGICCLRYLYRVKECLYVGNDEEEEHGDAMGKAEVE